MSLYLPETRIEAKAVVAKVVNILLGSASGILIAAVAAHALQILQH